MILTNGDGSVVGELPRTAEDVLARAEEHARDHYLAKRSYFPIAVREEIEAAGFQVSDSELATAMEKLDAVRSGTRAESIRIRVALDNGGNRRTVPHAKGNAMSSKPLTAHRFFEADASTRMPMPALGMTGWLAWTSTSDSFCLSWSCSCIRTALSSGAVSTTAERCGPARSWLECPPDTARR